eukprot:3982910-Pleurochrysis_carterae.AAC.1
MRTSALGSRNPSCAPKKCVSDSRLSVSIVGPEMVEGALDRREKFSKSFRSRELVQSMVYEHCG